MASDQANCTHHQYQNYGQHHRVLGDVLALEALRCVAAIFEQRAEERSHK
jgi:hypothetical protein